MARLLHTGTAERDAGLRRVAAPPGRPGEQEQRLRPVRREGAAGQLPPERQPPAVRVGVDLPEALVPLGVVEQRDEKRRRLRPGHAGATQRVPGGPEAALDPPPPGIDAAVGDHRGDEVELGPLQGAPEPVGAGSGRREVGGVGWSRHAATVPRRCRGRELPTAICGQRSGLWTTV